MDEFDEESVAKVLRDYVVGTLPLGVYDPHQPRRPRVPVGSFEVEFLDIDEDGRVCVAGPVVLEDGGRQRGISPARYRPDGRCGWRSAGRG